MLSAAEIANIVTLAAKASQEVQQKKLAAAFLSSLVQIADVAFSIAAKLAI